jgi:hypothetical protein
MQMPEREHQTSFRQFDVQNIEIRFTENKETLFCTKKTRI